MNNKNYILFYIFFFLIPFSYLGGGRFFLFARVLLIVYAMLPIFQHRAIKIVKDPFLILMIIVSVFFCYSHKKLYPFPTIIIFIEAYLLYSNNKIPFKEKHKGLVAFKNGCLFSAFVGVMYMFTNGIYIKGGEFVTNSWAISNITVPLFISFYIVGDVVMTLNSKKVTLLKICVWLIAFLLIVFLGKRGPIIFSILSIVISLFIHNIYFKRILLSILFIYPVWELPLITFITDTLKDSAETVFERMDDFNSVDDNPRIVRLQAAAVFLVDFSPRDLVGYHEDLILTKDPADVEHNHFHNFFLQLYYERGLLCVIGVLIILMFYKERKGIKSIHQKYAFAIFSFLLLIGMNESLMMCGMAGEILFFIIYLYHKQVYVYEKNH